MLPLPRDTELCWWKYENSHTLSRSGLKWGNYTFQSSCMENICKKGREKHVWKFTACCWAPLSQLHWLWDGWHPKPRGIMVEAEVSGSFIQLNTSYWTQCEGNWVRSTILGYRSYPRLSEASLLQPLESVAEILLHPVRRGNDKDGTDLGTGPAGRDAECLGGNWRDGVVHPGWREWKVLWGERRRSHISKDSILFPFSFIAIKAPNWNQFYSRFTVLVVFFLCC